MITNIEILVIKKAKPSEFHKKVKYLFFVLFGFMLVNYLLFQY